jgi:hypothetical protein
MDKIRVNRITVNIDKYNEVTISLYRTNVLLGTLTPEDLDIPEFFSTKISAKTYQAYCRDLVIELLNNDGIAGYYYEPKSTEHSHSIKYDKSLFIKGTLDYVGALLGDIAHILMDDRIIITDKYKDAYIKNSTGEFDIKLTQHNITIAVLSEIKSGQLCKPKTMKYNGSEYTFNITNVKKIIKLTQ